jgi:hypothetical protein
LAATINSYPTSVNRNTDLAVLFKVSATRTVVKIEVRLNGIGYKFVSGDVGATAGLWFRGPANAGRYRMSVFVTDTAGCTYESSTTSRVITVR